MIEDHDIAMLAEIHRIVVRFGPDAVSRLANLIRDPVHSEELARVLEYAATRPASKRISTRPRTTRKQNVDSVGANVLRGIALSDPEKYSLLSEIRGQLLSSTTLQSMAEIRRFARNHAIPIGTGSSRLTTIVPILRALSRLPLTEIASIRDSMKESPAADRSLERLRTAIVHPHSVRRGDSIVGKDDLDDKAQPR